jgi:hypothetical protein
MSESTWLVIEASCCLVAADSVVPGRWAEAGTA